MIIESLKPLAVQIDSLHGLPNNPRKGDVNAVMASLSRFGQRKPIVARRDDGRILAGNHTWQAAKQLGWTEIAVAFVGDDDITAQAYALADNRTAELGSYDDELLKELIEAVGSVDLDLLKDTGWSQEAVDELLTKIESEIPKVIDEDEVPEAPVEPKTKLGDVYHLGRHRLMCGDSTDESSVAKLMDGVKADMVFTDPPYNLEENGLLKRTNKGGSANRENFGNWDIGFDPLSVIPNIMKFVKNDTHIFICTSGFLFGGFTEGMINAGAKVNYLVWCKDNPMPSLSKSTYVHATELIVHARLGSPYFNYPNGSNLPNYLNGKVEPHTTGHPTQKPIYVPKFCIEPSSKPNEIILDLFGGSGSTLIAAEQTNRTCYMMELDPKYCDVIIQRWETLTGEKAVLIDNAKSTEA